ncbi:pentatricopeptide repeat-containing protein At3g23020 [Salvia miltiorrhiza]|uniref:pentatricopeptide repeat-containing protein At3g23020 n=1 Tax=Salvia miltiorrhiza TaxID=226208 RepID=UPI0025AD9A2A|nr:pentatricopeptide repeat-containing protein At3g23020 [Salvia miltiorrhiza]XP_057783308.1 pentatricopeptide repeat-containing protein At3g23020 [Salvia miltiorrhiza]XP_057783309.1 pentatricopeptide repeat-containing protein At3g23020 [Salvia miltiorrhiza]XP_057783311.1 pentatricopeptide repeat-containing protein At3g23020 [Salvia miltiorrhiza]
MFVQFSHSDTSCLRIFSSTTTPPNVGISVTPPPQKSSDTVKKKLKRQVLECPGLLRKNRFVKGPRGRIERNLDFGGCSGTQGGLFYDRNVVPEKEEEILENSDSKVGKNGSFDVLSVPENRVNEELLARNSLAEDAKNRVYRKVKGNYSKNGQGIRRDEGMQTKCSTKWGRYGGSIPAMLEALERISDLDEALKPWETTLTNKERSILLKEQLGWERAMEIFEWFKRKGCHEVNVIHYNIMLRLLGKARQWSEIERLWDEMAKNGVEPINSTYGTLIDVYSKGGRRDVAMKWLEMMIMRRMEPDEVTMGIVVQMYKKAGDFAAAEEFFKKWSRGNSVLEGRRGGVWKSKTDATVGSYTYNTLIDTYGKAGKLDEASKTFNEMVQKGISPNTVTFNTMIHMYGNNGQLDEVAALIGRMESAKCCPDTRTYNILISLHAKHNDIESAARYWKKMKAASLEPDAVSYRTLLYAYAIRHMVHEAEGLVSEMDERGLKIDEFTQSSLTRMYIEAGLLEESWSWFQRFHRGGGMTSECYSANIDAFGERGYVSLAEKVFDCCVQVQKLTVIEFNVMIKAYGIGGKFEQACCLFDSMGKHGLVADRCGYNSLVQMLASADLPETAIVYLRRMQEAGLVIDCVPYCAVISSYAKLGRVDKAVELYEDMISHNVKPDIIVYGVLINAFADTGNVEEATFYVRAMRNIGLSMNQVICTSLIKLYTKVGYLREAEEVYRTLQSLEAGLDVYSLNCMIDLYSERSMVAEAEEIFERLKQNGEANEFTHAMMLSMYKRNGRFVEAFWIARKMRELGLMTRLLTYNLVLGFYASDGRYKEAVATFREMLESHIVPDDSTFKSLGIILLKCGVPKSAVDKLEQTRKRDTAAGLQTWAATISSVVNMDDNDDDFSEDEV